MKNDSTSNQYPPESNPDEIPETFPQTLWTVVLQAQSGNDNAALKALNQLCEMYWYPVYAYIRRHGANADDAEDLTQRYFQSLLERDYLSRASREMGKLRAFLLTDLKFFLSNERRKKQSKRGGGEAVFVPIDRNWAEEHYGYEPVDETTPAKLFERRWAMTVLGRVLDEVRHDYSKRGREDLFDSLKQFILWNAGEEPYALVAERLGRDETYVKKNVQRLRALYRETLEKVVAETVNSPAEIEEEIRHLASAMC